MENNTKDRELLLTRTLNAPIDIVWEAWTKPDHIAKWWGPNGFITTIIKMDIQAGGEWDLIMHGPGLHDRQNAVVGLDRAAAAVAMPQLVSGKTGFCHNDLT